MGRNCSIIAALLITITTAACGQDYTIPIDTVYPFILYEADTLYWGNDSSQLVEFYRNLDTVLQTQSGNISILHIGGSHVQAGIMSHRIRTRLLQAAAGRPASRGILFPYAAANKCNNPHDYTVTRSRPFTLIRNVYPTHDYPLGITGIAVWCADTLSSFSIRFNDSLLPVESDTVILLGNTKGWPTDPVLKVDTLYHFPDYKDTTTGRYYFYFDRPIRDFTFFFPCSKGDTFIVNGILLKNRRPGITFHSVGVNGADVEAYLRCQNLERDLALIQPDLVIFGIGVNDAFDANFDTLVFKNRYIRLIEKIRTVNPRCAFIFITNNDTYKRVRRGHYSVNRKGPAARDAMYRLAEYAGGAVWDQFAIMGGLESMEQWRQNKLARYDRVHFTTDGYNLIGDLFYNAFIRELPRHEHR